MKKHILLFTLLVGLLCAPKAHAVSYRGFVELGGGYSGKVDSKDFYEFPILTTHGVQILNQLFIGVGAGVNFSDFHEASDTRLLIRAYGNVRWDGFGLFDNGKRISPFADFKLGWQTNGMWKGYVKDNIRAHFSEFSFNGFFMTPQIGIRIGCSSKVGFNIGLFYNYSLLKLGTKKIEKFVNYTYTYEYVDFGNIKRNIFGLSVGVDW